jgi:hypothetical protein
MAEQVQNPTGSAPSEERPFAIQTFTARYDPTEDRICLNAVDATGAKQTIYLTRRLMDQIIPVVVKHLEDKSPKGIPADLVQSMTQQRVRQARKAEPPADPVPSDLEAPRWLCTTILLQKRPNGLALTLAGDAECKAQISLADPHLRTVLDIFRNSYTKAVWDLRVFPDWLGQDQASIRPGAQLRLN